MIARTRSRTSRTLAAVATCAGLALVLVGCVKIDADVVVSSDATASGTFTLALQKQAASMLGMTDLDAFSKQITDDEVGGEGAEIFSSGDCTPSETDTDFVYACTFTDMAFTEDDGAWQIVKSGDTITFTMKGEGSAGDSGELLGDASLGTLTVNVTFPGTISEITGAEKTSDTTATMSASMNDAFDVKIVSAAGGGGGKIAATLVVLIGLLVLALIIVVAVVLILRRRKPAADSGTAYVVPPPAPGAGPTDAGAPTVAAPPTVEPPTVAAPPTVEPPTEAAPPAQPEEPTPPA